MDNKQEYIICAANHYNDGKEHVHQPVNVESGYVLTGMRHHNCISTFIVMIDALDGKVTREDMFEAQGDDAIQGFLTSKNRFLNRKEAGALAISVGQIEKTNYLSGGRLDSSDLY